MLSLFLCVLMTALLVGGLPVWPHSRGWGYYPSGAAAVILIVIIQFSLFGYL